MPLILPGNVASATADAGYSVANSCRYNDDDSPRLHIDSLGTATDIDKWTFSCWFKRSTLSSTQYLLYAYTSGQEAAILLNSDNKLDWYNYPGSGAGQIITNRLFRDVSAWYHLVCSYDGDNGTAGNRMRIYINGVEETSFATDTNPSSGEDQLINSDVAHNIGLKFSDAIQNNFDGYFSEVCLVDGQQLTPSSFGEFNEDSPTIWQPIDVSGLTFGDNGFYLDFEDSGDLGDDESGNGNDFTETNLAAADQATDTPTNNFATLNPLDNYYASSTFSEGNCKVVQGSSTYAWNLSTIAVTAGKWYVEAKLTTDSEHALVGITDTSPVGTGTKILGSGAYDYSIKQANGDLFNNAGDDPSNDDADYAAAYAQNDIIGIALDITNSKIYFSKGGAWSDGSGSWDSTTFDAAVGAVTITAPASTNNGHYFFASGDYGSASCTWEWNFGGCPPNTISSGNADGNGYGNFEYAVPSGYLALCTKNLGSDGG